MKRKFPEDILASVFQVTFIVLMAFGFGRLMAEEGDVLVGMVGIVVCAAWILFIVRSLFKRD